MPAWHWALIGAAIFMPVPFLFVALAVLVPWQKVPWREYGRRVGSVWPWALVAAALFVPWHRIHWHDAGEITGTAVFWIAILWMLHRVTRPAATALPVVTVPATRPTYARSEIWAASTLTGSAAAVLLSLGGWLAFQQMQRGAVSDANPVGDLFFFALVPVLGTLVVVTATSLTNGFVTWPRSLYAGLGAAIGFAAGGLHQFLEIQPHADGRPHREIFDSIGPFDLSSGGQPTLAAYVALFVLILTGPGWAKMLHPQREYRLRMWPVVWTAGFGFLASFLFGFDRPEAIVWAGTMAAASQLAAPWQPHKLSVGKAA